MFVNSSYPRVLIIYSSKINVVDSYAGSIRSWFSTWPRNILAQIYSSGDESVTSFCGFTYKLQNKDRLLGRYFNLIKKSPIVQTALPITIIKENKINKTIFNTILSQICKSIIYSGIWELFFRPMISKSLQRFILEFRPQIIYCQGYNLTFTILPLLISKKYKIPICFQTGDDWPTNRYRDGIFSLIMRPIIVYYSSKLIRESTVRFSNSEKMSSVYFKRYSIDFTKLMICDNLERFKNSPVLKLNNKASFSIIYTGSLSSYRWESIIDLSDAAYLLLGQDIKIDIFALTSNIPPEGLKQITTRNNIFLLPDPPHDLLPSYLKGADLLFLPESFNMKEAKRIQLSLSSKSHLYMFSEVPILVYSPSITGVSYYASRDEWAYVLNIRNVNLLANAIKELIFNPNLRSKLILKGKKTALINHNEKINQKIFLDQINKGIGNNSKFNEN